MEELFFRRHFQPQGKIDMIEATKFSQNFINNSDCGICLASAEELFEKEPPSPEPCSDTEIQKLAEKIGILKNKQNQLSEESYQNILCSKKKSSRQKKQRKILSTSTLETLISVEQRFLKLTKRLIVIIGHEHSNGFHTSCNECFHKFIKTSTNCYVCRGLFKKSPKDTKGSLQCKQITVCIDTGNLINSYPYYPSELTKIDNAAYIEEEIPPLIDKLRKIMHFIIIENAIAISIQLIKKNTESHLINQISELTLKIHLTILMVELIALSIITYQARELLERLH